EASVARPSWSTVWARRLRPPPASLSTPAAASCRQRPFLTGWWLARRPSMSPARTRLGILLSLRSTVNILDVNNHAPNITNLPGTWRIAENSSIGSGQVYNLTVQDLDAGQNANVSLTLVSGNDRGWFSIVDGFKLTAASNIDREAPGLAYDSAGNGRVLLVVMATDAGSPTRLSSTGILTVLVGDVNDSPPRFAAGTDNRQYQLAESTSVGSVVVPGFDVLDNDLATTNSFVFSLGVDGNFNETFQITPGGSLKLNKQLSRAAKAQFNLTIYLTDGVFNTSTFITIIVMDSNNNSPVFGSPLYQFFVTENDRSGVTGQLIGQVQADDPDTGLNGKVVYSVGSPSNHRYLLAISENGTVTLNGTLDREANAMLVFSIVASDMGVSPRFTTAELRLTILDINDNQPEFTAPQYVGSVPENSPAGTEVYFLPSLQATDRDADNNSFIEYSIVDSPSLPFVINASTGSLTVAPGASLDREALSSGASFAFTVAAFNSRGQPSTLNRTLVSVVVRLADVNDNAPTFGSGGAGYNFSVSEGAGQFTSVGRVAATDPDAGDNGTVMYFIVSGSDSRFVINISTGEIQLLYPVDRELKDFYLLNVSAVDRGSPALSSFVGVSVVVTDINDVAPTFQPSASTTFVLTEESMGVRVVGRLNATDADFGDNGRVTYFLTDSTALATFNLNASDGLLTTVETVRLDREATPVIRFLAFARDSGAPTSLTGTTEVTVRLSDVNDWSPTFSETEYRVYTLEKTPVNSILMVALATDHDEGPNANLTYSVTGNGSDFVSVEVATGFVRLAKQLTLSELLNRGLVRQNGTGNDTAYTPLVLQLTAFDNPTDDTQPGRNGTAALLIFLNQITDQLPTFSQVNYQFSLAENSSPGSLVGAVNATLSAGSAFSVRYRLLNSNPLFQVDEVKGNITVRLGAQPDRENSSQTPYLVITVMAFTDSTPSRQAFSVVLVTLTDVNDNSPQFAAPSYTFAVVEEPARLPFSVGFVSASDADAGSNAAVFFAILGDTSGLFEVDSGTGKITAVKRLNREAAARYTFQVVAADGGSPVRSTTVGVVVQLEDVNDNPPSLPTLVSANVTEGLPADTLVTMVTASDPDIGLNATVGFRLIQTEVPPMFYLQPDGAGNVSVKTLGKLDYATKSLYNLILIAYDLGNPSLSSTATLSATVQRLDRSVPRFDSTFYNASLPDNLAPGTPVFDIPASSTGVAFNYSLGSSGNANGAFVINSRGR
uniref:Cadherin domain-containing protein n=1 Tax=Macrostomum lignano TaxID=282301 RepID=A0A1I8IML6_9PLAT